MAGCSRRGALLVLLTVASLAGALVVVGAPASLAVDCPRTGAGADLTLLAASAGAAPNVRYAFTVRNSGPDCVAALSVTVALAPGSSFSDAVVGDREGWSCSGTTVVECKLIAPLPAADSATVSFEATAPSSPTGATVRGEVKSDLADPELSDNVAWTAFAARASTGDPRSLEQVLDFSRPGRASIAINRVLPGSALGAPGPAPCEPTCLGTFEWIVETPDTDPALFPDVRLSLTLKLFAPGTRARDVRVYRFVDSLGAWVGPLPSCSEFTGDPVVGCVSRVSVSREGFVQVVIWTSHNGHSRIG
jgi:hypothetical protein